jgi:hypothetical protein
MYHIARNFVTYVGHAMSHPNIDLSYRRLEQIHLEPALADIRFFARRFASSISYLRALFHYHNIPICICTSQYCSLSAYLYAKRRDSFVLYHFQAIFLLRRESLCPVELYCFIDTRLERLRLGRTVGTYFLNFSEGNSVFIQQFGPRREMRPQISRQPSVELRSLYMHRLCFDSVYWHCL